MRKRVVKGDGKPQRASLLFNGIVGRMSWIPPFNFSILSHPILSTVIWEIYNLLNSAIQLILTDSFKQILSTSPAINYFRNFANGFMAERVPKRESGAN